ncbi:MAG: hypothetical protein ACI8XC_004382, partial [Gammaproteobacteria bacterium]
LRFQLDVAISYHGKFKEAIIGIRKLDGTR